MKTPRLLASLTGLLLLTGTVFAETAAPSQADLLSPTLKAKDAANAWAELDQASRPPAGPAEWTATPPTPEQKQKYYKPFVLAAADKSKDFYTRFKSDAHTTEAKLSEFQLLFLSLGWGQTNLQSRFETVGKALIGDPAVKGADHYDALLRLARYSPTNQAMGYLQSIMDSGDAPPQTKEAATEMRGTLAAMEMVGKPVELKFTAVDGRAVDVSKLKGKVVLVDFWATWCGPCVHEMPDVKKAYDQYHDKGFEIVGISLDREKEKLTDFTTEHKMPWPQFFDGLYWNNKYAMQFGIHSIPTMWLIDKKGNLRNQNAYGELADDLPKLLAE